MWTLLCAQERIWAGLYCVWGCMWSMQSNVKVGAQLSICSGIEENHGKPWSSWPVAGPSGCKLTCSHQFGIQLEGSVEERRGRARETVCFKGGGQNSFPALKVPRQCIDKNPVRTSQETHYVSATKPNRLMLFKETVAVYCDNHTEHTLCGQNAET
jgi:hypothetical protein